ncbi:MAG: hypothetical protein RQ756_03890 [Flavobacteriaceae bacterium]|nr:hypothetical protein [Flavobacteriaceae bacterium]
MKKVFLTAVAVVALGSFALKANPLKAKAVTFEFIDCVALAFAIDDATPGGISFEMFDRIVRNCEAMQ